MKLGKRRRNALAEMSPARPPVATFDLQADLAWVQVLSLMCWPNDQRGRRHAEATIGADLLGWLETLMPGVSNLGVTDPEAEAEAAIGIQPNRLEFMPATHAHFTRSSRNPLEMAREVAGQVFKPAGGFKAVADALGTSRVVEEFTRASTGGARMAGYMLMWVAVLDARRPDLGASINRAMAILENQQRRFPNAGIPSNRSLKAMWKEWRGIAPVWAALILQSHSDSLHPREAVIETLFDPQRRLEMMGWALWFRSFATTFKPQHSEAPIISASEAVELAFGVEPIRPPPVDRVCLNPDDIRAAYGAEHGGDYRWNPLSTPG